MRFAGVSPLCEWRPRWRWFKLGAFMEVETFPRIVVGFGIISFEAHFAFWAGGLDIDAYVNCPLGNVGAHVEFLQEEESSEVR